MTTTPPSTDPSILDGNLRALLPRQERLVERLHWPVAGDHLRRDEAGGWSYRYREADLDPAVDPETLGAELDALRDDRGKDPERVFVFGVGLGEGLVAALERFPDAEVTAWDRDPWVLRQLLSERDLSGPIAAGRLHLELGGDLARHAEVGWPGAILWHPLLSLVYGDERLLLSEGLRGRVAFLAVGELFVDSLADNLREEGFSVYGLDAQRLAVDEVAHAVEALRPEILLCVNHVNGLAEFCEGHGVDYLCWEIDPTTDEPRTLGRPAPHARVFTHRRLHVESFERAGFERVEYLPLAADSRRRRPLELDDEERARYGAPVTFVGNSLMHNVRAYIEGFARRVADFDPSLRESAPAIAAELVAQQREDLDRFILPELVDARLPGLRAQGEERGLPDPALLLGEVSAAEKRLNLVAELAPLGIEVWGDGGWERLEAHGVRYRGPARHEHDLSRIYAASAVNVDVGRLYQDDIVTMRVFDVLACGGFVLAEHSRALEELFEVGVEVESYRGPQELHDKVEHFLKRPGEARATAEKGRRAVLERHDFRGRLRTMLAGIDGPRRGLRAVDVA